MPTIDVRQYGDAGPTIVMLHGGPGAPGSIARLALDLSPRFQVLEPLQRRSGDEPLSVERHVADLAAIVEGPCRIVGHSWGAMLGLCFAAAQPGLVDRLALVGCGTFDDSARAVHDKVMAERLGPEGTARMRALRRAMTHADASERDLLLAKRGRQALVAQSVDLLPDSLDAAATDLPLDALGHEETWNDVLRRQRERVDPDGFSAITCPVTMIHGDADPHPGPATRDTLRRFVPQLEYVELKDCGHAPWLERHARTRFLALMQEWGSS
jgi:pimeloyl-ACP methyl ester carboxylesterase